MKKLLLTILSASTLFFSQQATAQHCDASPALDCGLPLSVYGFGNQNVYGCMERGINDTVLYKFKCYTSFTASIPGSPPQTVNLQGIRIDSIENLPCGLCWSSSSSTNEFAKDNSGCIRFTGKTTDAAGQYNLRLIISADTDPTAGSGYEYEYLNADFGKVYLYLRVTEQGAICTSTGSDTIKPSIPGIKASKTCPLGINEVNSNGITALTLVPNPMNSEAKISFAAENAGTETIRLFNILGREVYNNTISVRSGMNETIIKRNDMPNGVYILSIGNGKTSATKKFVISE
jgi:hypothetical protein